MEEKRFYPVDAVFPSQQALNNFIKRKNPVFGKYLIAGSNDPKHYFIAFYDPQKNQIELELKGKSIEDLLNLKQNFLKLLRI